MRLPDLDESGPLIGPEGQIFGVGNLRELALLEHPVGERPHAPEALHGTKDVMSRSTSRRRDVPSPPGSRPSLVPSHPTVAHDSPRSLASRRSSLHPSSSEERDESHVARAGSRRRRGFIRREDGRSVPRRWPDTCRGPSRLPPCTTLLDHVSWAFDLPRLAGLLMRHRRPGAGRPDGLHQPRLPSRLGAGRPVPGSALRGNPSSTWRRSRL